MVEYGYTFRRLDLIKKSLEQILKTNTELQEANKKLREMLNTQEARHQAELRVLSEEAKK